MVVTPAEPPRKHQVRDHATLDDPLGSKTRRARSGPREAGQATVEFVALLPILALLAVAVGQAAVAGWAAWSAGGAARYAARAQALGDDPQAAARRVLPATLGRHAHVTVGRAGTDAAGRATVR
ncbi:MAG: hypothetical protein QM679_12855, partial [Patulibacter sp.]